MTDPNDAAITDEAIALFSNKGAKETVLPEQHEDYVDQFNKFIEELLSIPPAALV